MAAPIAKKLSKVLKQIDRPSAFCFADRVPVVLPGLKVKGVGLIGLPVHEGQARELISVCHQAPYGKGEKTVVDTSVRRVWALEPELVTFTNPEWPDFMDRTVGIVQERLGLQDEKLACHFYQLLLYEQGSFFLPHQDGEKLDGMVATLVVAPPSVHEGGELVIRHGGREETMQFGGPEGAYSMHIAAFYADCEHEIKPVRNGYRISLVYNITLARSKGSIRAPQYGGETAEISKVLNAWQEVEKPEKLAIVLDHEYTANGLSFERLKGADRARAQALFTAATGAGCQAYLALLTLYKLGAAECDFDYEGYYRNREPDNYDMGEVYEQSLTADHWTDAGGNAVGFGELSFDDDEIVSEIDLTGIDPEEEFEGYTGNAGMELQRWYRHGAIVLWSQRRHFEILCDAGIDTAIAGLSQMLQKWAGQPANETLKGRCLMFAKTILEQWPERKWTRYSYGVDRGGNRMIAILDALDDSDLIATYIGDILARDDTEHPRDRLAAICRRHGWRTYRDELLRLFEIATETTIARDIAILESLCLQTDKGPDRRALCRDLAAAALAAVKRVDRDATPADTWSERRLNRRESTTSLVKSLYAAGAPEALTTLVDHIINLPDKYDLTDVQIPVLLDLGPWWEMVSPKNCDALKKWLATTREALISRTENEPQPPVDWRRPATIPCTCADCGELKSFLENPAEPMHRFRVNKDRRQHLHQIIERHQCDTTHVTERRGSPYTLVCKKTQGLYGRRRQVYDADCRHLAGIEAMQKRFHAGNPMSAKPALVRWDDGGLTRTQLTDLSPLPDGDVEETNGEAPSS